MSNNSVDIFQEKVDSLIARNRNILDILTKCQVTCSKVCRSTVKSATGCGCLKITGEKSVLDFSQASLKKESVHGKLCHNCKSIIEDEIGESLFYIASLCNALGFSMEDIMTREIEKVEVLGKYSLH